MYKVTMAIFAPNLQHLMLYVYHNLGYVIRIRNLFDFGLTTYKLTRTILQLQQHLIYSILKISLTNRALEFQRVPHKHSVYDLLFQAGV